jgi:hypothetical protein
MFYVKRLRLSSQFVWGHSRSVLNNLRGEVPCDSTNLHKLIAENLDKPKVDAKQWLKLTIALALSRIIQIQTTNYVSEEMELK